jgi:archaeal flagellin N-terminal-like domain
MFKELFSGTDDDRGVSPVIGVILMVAITVILAAVIGAFVLGLGDQVSTQAPQASIGFSFDGNNVTLAHEGGDNLDKSTIEVTMGGKLLYDDSGLNSTNTDDTAPLILGQTQYRLAMNLQFQ